MLYLVATPIGNLEDISFRALKVIEMCDYLLCEDTRRTRLLLDRYQLQKPLRSFHKFNEAHRHSTIIDDLKSKKNIALVSDAGTPTLFDPGFRLIAACRDENIPVVAIPGPASPIVALILSGFDTNRFQCIGFLPKKSTAMEKILSESLNYPGTTIALESPHRLIKTLTLLQKIDSTRPLFVARELTKKFEEQIRGNPSYLLAHWKNRKPKGEIILVIQGNKSQ